MVRGKKSLCIWSRSHYQDSHHTHTHIKIFSETRSPMILKLGVQHPGLKVHKVSINDDPWLTVTYFTARSNLAAFAFEWEKLL